MKSKIFTLLATTFVLILTLNTSVQSIDASPQSFSWDNLNNKTYLGSIHNQNFPFACNSGWAFATISMVQTRIKRKRNAASPDVSLSTQVLLSCDTLDFGCLGGQPSNALRWIIRNNITDQTCHSYKARGYTEGQTCNSQAKCQKCISNDSCKAQSRAKVYGLSHFGTLATEVNMMKQIQTYGPIACGISVSTEFKTYTKGIFSDKTGTKGANHYVLVYGWGVQKGQKYWLAQNSWGSNWGENGTFRIEKGTNNLGIQNLCYWTSPYDTWTKDLRNQTLSSQKTLNQQFNGQITYKIPDYLTHSRSLLTPHYCQASWAFSLNQMLKDRVSKVSNRKQNIDLSIQSLLNCGLGNCTQSDPFEALNYIHKYGVPEQNCQNYKGQKLAKQNCSAINNCATCTGTTFKSSCTEVKNFKRWKLTDFGAISGQQNMMTEIDSYGPIVCGVDKSSTVFTNYEGGIIKEVTISPKINHYVQVVGYGSQDGVNYWVARNFWGTAWGEEGFFRIKKGSNILGIQKRCLWGNLSL